MENIAEKAGVSRPTVSLVLGQQAGFVGISVQTQQRVLEVARQLGYRPNQVARAMAKGRTCVLDYLVRWPEVEYGGLILTGAIEAAQAREHFIRVLDLGASPDWRAVIHGCVEHRPAGVMSFQLAEEMSAYLREELARYRIPWAVLGATSATGWDIHVSSDDQHGCYQAIEHLASLGHRDIAFIGGNPETLSAVLREQGYRAAMRQLGLEMPHGRLVYGNWEAQQTEQVTLELLANREHRPTAIFCANDPMAMVVLRTARKLGMQVPQDLSVIGFSDLAMASYSDPPLTTIAHPLKEAGQLAVQQLIENGGGRKPSSVSLPTEKILPVKLVVRQSTAQPNRSLAA